MIRSFFLMVLFVFGLSLTLQAEAPKSKTDDFYMVNIAAVGTEKEAKAMVQSLINQGERAAWLWIPDYPSLSGAHYFSVYIGPFTSQQECEVATEKYRKRYPDACGLLVSQKSTEVRIMGIGKVTSTEYGKKQDMAFGFRHHGEDSMGMPSSTILLSYRGAWIPIARVNGEPRIIDRGDFASYNVPQAAVAACGSWWAGSGDYFYVIKSKNQIVVFKGWVDEQQKEAGYHWKMIKKFVR
ncbi:MAG: SPOR domain-containing protein [Geobacteraceae bacterium]|nr:SPOR domain-containing protein [Geobacteraceae bacterium]